MKIQNQPIMLSLLLLLGALNTSKAGFVLDYLATAEVSIKSYGSASAWQSSENAPASAETTLTILKDLPDIWWDTQIASSAYIEASDDAKEARITSSLYTGGGDDFLGGYAEGATFLSGTLQLRAFPDLPVGSPLTLLISIQEDGFDEFGYEHSCSAKIWTSSSENPLVSLELGGGDGYPEYFANTATISTNLFAGQTLNIEMYHYNWAGVGHSFAAWTDFQMTFSVRPVPVPDAFLLSVLGAGLSAWLRRRETWRRKSSSRESGQSYG